MALSFRLIWALFTGFFKAKVPPHGPVTRSFRVWPFLDAETGVTLNAAKYFQLAEIVQTECNFRSGFIGAGMKHGIWAIALGNQIHYKKALKRFQNDKFFVWQNTFKNQAGEIAAISYSKVAARSRQGLVSAEECFRMMKVEPYKRPLDPNLERAFQNFEALPLSSIG
jgi:hypothetical protein